MTNTQLASLIKFYNKTRQTMNTQSVSFSPSIINVRQMKKSIIEDQCLQNCYNKVNEVSTTWERVRKQPYFMNKEHHMRYQLSEYKLENKDCASHIYETELKNKCNTLKKYITNNTPKRLFNHKELYSKPNIRYAGTSKLMYSNRVLY